jgi:serine/threonine-protein kinase SRPK3
MDEIKILKQIAEGDPSDMKCVVKLLDHFKHSGPNGSHVCMVFEFLGDNLLTLIKYTDYRGIPLNMVKEVCRHVLIGLDYLHRELSIIHTDLKPENILLLSSIDPSKDPTKSGAELILPKPKEADDAAVAKPTVTVASSSNGGLTKNQKKKIKRKAKKAVAATSASGADVTEDSSDKGDIDSDAGSVEGKNKEKRRGSKGTRRRMAMEVDLR